MIFMNGYIMDGDFLSFFCDILIPFCFFQNQLFIFSGFLVFETCVGIFWPALSTMRGKYVPEASTS